ncbi:NAD(P)H-quinone oxidoreductase subunit O, chloroplastic [Typha angustifolia]|uniref:NAD(P)H-quinone oxidoreductase subunit O, chloroplastic n=1 Tax=Typha angustifolia TaxID=59011 RepID=UPI003C2B99C9
MASLVSRSSPLLSLFASKNTTAFWRRPRTLAPRINAVASSSEPEKEKSSASGASATAAAATSSSSTRSTSTLPKKPVYSMKKGQIVRVDKEKYLNSINYLSVDHPPYYKGLDYIYEDRGEVLDIRIFETGEYALIAWVGIPTAPAWLPTDMLIKSEKLNYERI